MDDAHERGRPPEDALNARPDRKRADQGRNGIATRRDVAIRGHDVQGIQHPVLGNPDEDIARRLNRLEPNPPAPIEGPDPPRDRTANAAIAVIQEDVGRIFHGLGNVSTRGLKQAGRTTEL